MPGPGSVHMEEAEVISLLSSDPEAEDEAEDEAFDDSDEGYAYTSDEDEDLGLAEEQPSITRGRQQYRVIDEELLKQVQGEAVSEVASIWNCKRSVAKTLLMHYMWDKEKLLGDLAERGPGYVYKAAGVAEPDDSSKAVAGPLDLSAKLSCEVCMCECPGSQCARNGCGHTFCNDCWRSHLQVQITDGKARHVACMAYKCGVVCDEELVLSVIQGEPELLTKYKQSHLQSYMEDNQRVAFCPSVPWCGRAIEVESDPYVEPECSCGTTFCFKCAKDPHSPCTCAMWAAWDEKISGDSETRNWMQANTKPCPKCTKPVEKNGGCNLVVCKCGQPFCWLCGAATGVRHTWTQIDNHSCGRYKDEAEARVNEALRNHNRYMHYFTRYQQHLDSLKKEKDVKLKLTAKVSTAERDGTDNTDFSWLLKALDQLITARQVLSNSYAFAYFFFGGELYSDEFSADENVVNQNLFEDNQEQLAVEVERLSDLIAKAKNLQEDSDQRFNVINSSVNIHTRIVKFFEMVENDLYGKLQKHSAQIAVSYRGKE